MTRRLEMYDSYKASGVERIGQIPHHWKTVPLKGRCNIVNGATPKSGVADYWDGVIAWVTPADLTKLESFYVRTGGRSISTVGYDSCGTQLVPAGSVILSSRAPIGTVAIAERQICTNQGCKSLVPRKNLNSEYLYYVLAVSSAPLNVLGRGSTFLELSSDELGRFQLACPEVEEQTQIAKFLDYETAKIDALIEKQQQLIALLKEKRQAVISHAVTKGLNPDAPMRDSGVEWLGEVPAHWVLSQPKYFCRRIIDGPHHTPTYVDEGIPFVTVKNLTSGHGISLEDTKRITLENHVELIKRAHPEVGDLLITKDGTLGVTRVVETDREFSIFVSVALIKLDRSRVDPYFMRCAFESSATWTQFTLRAAGAALQHIVLSTIGNVLIPLPPLPEQVEIAKWVSGSCSKLDELIGKAIEQVELLQERRTALISAAVTGKIDVRNWKPPGDLDSNFRPTRHP